MIMCSRCHKRVAVIFLRTLKNGEDTQEGFMRIAKDCGLIEKLSGLFAPLLRHLYPDVEPESEAFRYISMNISANLLGLGNAATPLGISAMRELKKHSDSDRATDSMVTFVLMNTASIQLIPTTVAALRKSYGSQQPFDILMSVWLTSAAALAAGLLSSALIKKGSSCHKKVSRATGWSRSVN